jgi:hypothetical protein
MFSSKNADEKVKGSSIPKIIQPGNVIARVLDMTLEVPPYDSNAFNLILSIETKPIGEGFEGLPIDKDVPDLGTYQGQIAKVLTQQYSYSDYTNKEGKTTTKEDMIFRWLWSFAKEIKVADILREKDISGDTIQEYLENAKAYLIDKDRWIHWCIGGSEYENKAGYTQYRLFVVKYEKNKSGFELYQEGVQPTRLIKFDESVHIKKKKPSDDVTSFSGRDGSSDLDLD